MFNIFKNWFNTGQDPLGITGESEMARIDADNNLYGKNGEFIGSYSRRRDAVRGAKRRGLEVA